MATREASVKLTLSNSQFLTAIKDTGNEVDRLGKKGKRAMSLLGDGLGGAKRALGDLGASIKSTLGMAATLGGAFSMGSAINSALKLRTTYSQLAFQIQTATGRTTSFADVQRVAERAATNTGRSTEEMTEAFASLVQATGDVDFAEGALTAIGTTATATGKSLDAIGTVADQLHTKFGVSAEGMQDALAQVFEASTKGGPAFEEFAGVMAGAGAELLAAGLEGQRGLNFMLGALVETDDKMKDLPAQVKGLKAVLRGLGNEGDLKKLAESIGIDPKKLINEKDAIARLRRVLGSGKKGVDALMGSMNEGEEKEVMKILFTDPFEKALSEAQASGAKGRAAIDQALTAFDEQIGEFGKATMNGAQLVERANELRQTPEARLNEALDRLNQKFGDPRIIDAIGKLSEHLPRLAELFGSLVAFAAESPVLAASLAIAGKAATGFAQDLAGAAIKQLLTGAAGAAGSAAAGAAGAGAAGAAGGAAAGGALAALAVPAAIIAGAAATFAIGAEQIDNAYDREADVVKELAEATASAGNRGSLEQMRKQLERLEAAKSNFREANVGGGIVDRMGDLVTGRDSKALAGTQLTDAQTATAQLQRMIKEREQEIERRAAAPAGAVAAATPSKPAPVKLEDNAGKMIGDAVGTALGGKVLTVRIANAGELGVGRASAGPGGSRGPMVAQRTTPGGGY